MPQAVLGLHPMSPGPWGRGDLRLNGLSGLAVISEELLGQME